MKNIKKEGGSQYNYKIIHFLGKYKQYIKNGLKIQETKTAKIR